MKNTLMLFGILIFLQACSLSKEEYLENNRFDLTSTDFNFPEKDFKIIGFGAYHGSAKTERAEYHLIKSLAESGTVKYYLPETDFSIGHYFNKYLETGDTLLLKDLVYHYGIRVPQDRTIETYNKWKEIKELNDQLPEKNKLTVVGVDLMVSYKYSCKHLMEIADFTQIEDDSFRQVVNMVESDTTDFSPYYDSYSKKVLKDFVTDYEKRPEDFDQYISDPFSFKHIVDNLKQTFMVFSAEREKRIYKNYTALSDLYDFENNPQFFRYGFFHIEKEREGGNPSFFTMLLENNVYNKEEVLSTIGYLTKSRVLWERVYEDGEYKSYKTEGGYGIGDYEKEYFLGIENLKKTRMSDITLFRLNQQSTPYNDGNPDLIEVVMQDSESNGELVKGKSTTDFIDYAILISDSKASIPIEEMK